MKVQPNATPVLREESITTGRKKQNKKRNQKYLGSGFAAPWRKSKPQDFLWYSPVSGQGSCITTASKRHSDTQHFTACLSRLIAGSCLIQVELRDDFLKDSRTPCRGPVCLYTQESHPPPAQLWLITSILLLRMSREEGIARTLMESS